MRDKQRIWGFFSHASMIIGMMFVVFFVIDRFNPAMEFLTSSLSKWLMLVLALCAMITGLYSAIFLFQKQKRRDDKRSQAQTRPASEKESALPQRPAKPYRDSRYSQQRQPNEYNPNQGYQPDKARNRNAYPQEQPGYSAQQPAAGYERRESYHR